MILTFDMEKYLLIQKISEEIEAVPSLRKRIVQIRNPDAIVGTVREDRIRLVKTTPYKTRFPQRNFYGRVYQQEAYTLIKGCFHFPPLELGVILIACLLVFPLISYYSGVFQFTIRSYLPFLLLFILVLFLTYVGSVLIYRKEEENVITFLRSIANSPK